MEIILTKNNIEKIVKDILIKVNKNNTEGATIITLKGDLGTGKTTLSKEIAKQFGIKENVASPTFVIMKRYFIDDSRFKNLIHIDAYRLNKSEDLVRLGWEEISQNKDNIIVIEWPEMVSGCLSKDVYNISLEHIDEETRLIKF